MSYTKEQILESVKKHHPEPVSYREDDLVMSFGFKQTSGIDIALGKLLGKSARSMQVASTAEMAENIGKWCRENNLSWHQPFFENCFVFSLKPSNTTPHEQ